MDEERTIHHLEQENGREVTNKQELLRQLKQSHAQETEEPRVQVIIVALDGQLYGMKILSVREILKVSKITWVPWTPKFIIGVISLRGDIQSVVDLKFFLQLGVSRLSERSRIILVESKELVTGLLVDEMVDIIDVPVRTFLPLSESNMAVAQRYIEGKFPWKEKMVTLLNVDTLLQGVVVNQG